MSWGWEQECMRRVLAGKEGCGAKKVREARVSGETEADQECCSFSWLRLPYKPVQRKRFKQQLPAES